VDDTERRWHAGRDRPRYVCSRPDHASFMRNEQRLAIIDTPIQGWVRS
jgi:hypothetical protein